MPEIPAPDQKIQFTFYGVGGKEMESAGVELMFDYQDIAVMGLVEVISSIPRIYLRLQQAKKAILAFQPDVVITIDSPGFCFRLVEELREIMQKKSIYCRLVEKLCKTMPKKSTDCLFIHYVAPTVWAYKHERAETIKRLYDSIILILPFETHYFADMPHIYIGNPVVEDKTFETDINQEKLLKKLKLPQKSNLISLFPGSRKQEIKRHMPILVSCIRMIIDQSPSQNYLFIIHTLDYLAEFLNNWLEDNASDLANIQAIKVISDQESKNATLRCSKLALVKGGTITLNVLAFQIPMIVFYQVAPLTARIMQRKCQIKNFALANLILDRIVVPEFIQNDCTAENLANAALKILAENNSVRAQDTYYKKLWDILGANEKQTPSEKAARHLVDSLFLNKII